MSQNSRVTTLPALSLPVPSVDPLDRWWIPTSIRHLRLWGIEPQGQSKLTALRRWQPVRFLVRARALVLDIEIERTVSVERERVAVADGEAVERVGDLEALRVVHGQRPEGADRWQFILR